MFKGHSHYDQKKQTFADKISTNNVIPILAFVLGIIFSWYKFQAKFDVIDTNYQNLYNLVQQNKQDITTLNNLLLTNKIIQSNDVKGVSTSSGRLTK